MKTKRVMNPVEKRKWVKALLSGKFKQGEGALISRFDPGTPTYCCLGVAAECITGRKPTNNRWFLKNGRFGLSSKLQQALANANDGWDYGRKESFENAGFSTYPGRGGRKASFKTIANWINKNL